MTAGNHGSGKMGSGYASRPIDRFYQIKIFHAGNIEGESDFDDVLLNYRKFATDVFQAALNSPISITRQGTSIVVESNIRTTAGTDPSGQPTSTVRVILRPYSLGGSGGYELHNACRP
jgi:hypothetical protein